jgi:WD40 repeat protein
MHDGAARGCMAGQDGHRAPVLELALASNGGLEAVSGDRNGDVRCWDVHRAKCCWAAKAAHKGHVTSLKWCDDAGGNDAWTECFASGGQDGYLRVWDARSHQRIASCGLHCNGDGRGAVTGLIMGATLGHARRLSAMHVLSATSMPARYDARLG